MISNLKEQARRNKQYEIKMLKWPKRLPKSKSLRGYIRNAYIIFLIKWETKRNIQRDMFSEIKGGLNQPI